VNEVTLGQRYRDVATGFEGTAIGRAVYLYEEASVLVIAETKQAAADSRWIAENRLEPANGRAAGFGAG
jgi:hypothetical protein